MSQQENQINVNSNNNDSSSSMDAEVLEQGDIYFFCRLKKGAEESGLSSTVNQGSRANI